MNIPIQSISSLIVLAILFFSCKKEDSSDSPEPIVTPVTPVTQNETTDTFIDSRDGNSYKWVKIGNQVWMGENLAYLPTVSKGTDGSESVAGSYYYVHNYEGTDVSEAKATNNYKTYGVLYNWNAAISACPSGWHLPSDAEWTQLTDYVMNDGHSGIEASVLKSVTGWTMDPDNTDNYNFTALPGGYRSSNGTFHNIGYNGIWWSATEHDASYAFARYLSYFYSYVYRNESSKESGFCVRCVRD